MNYFSNNENDLYQNPPIDAGRADGKNEQYDPLSKTQLNPYLDVDKKQLQKMYNMELDVLESKSDKTMVAQPTPIQSYTGRLDAFVNRDRSKPVTEEMLESVRGPGYEKQKFAIDFKKKGGNLNTDILKQAMELKGLKRGGGIPKMVEGGDLTVGQQSTINWSNIASTAVDIGVNTSNLSSQFNPDGDPYSEMSKKDTIKAFVGERAAKGAQYGGTAGAAIGSVIPVVGTAVGAAVGTAIGSVVGAVSGFFGGKKQAKKDAEAREERLEAESIENIAVGNQVSELISQKESLTARTDYMEGLNVSSASMKYGGMVYGPRHEQGGVMAYKDGKPIAEVEGDEYVINNDILKDKPESKNKYVIQGTPVQIASALNSINKYGVNSHPGGKVKQVS